MKKAISLGVAAAMTATLLAGCGTAASSSAATSEAASTAESTAAESTAEAAQHHRSYRADHQLVGRRLPPRGLPEGSGGFPREVPQHHRLPHLRRMVRLGREAVHRAGR